MANTNAQMAEFANNLWENFIKKKFEEENADILSYYRAEVVTNDGNNKLTIQRPYDDPYQVSCTDDMSEAVAGMQVIVVRFGNSANNNNHIVVAKSDANKPTTTTWHIPTITNNAITITNGGYYVLGRHCYVQMRFTMSADLNADSGIYVASGMPQPVETAAVISILANVRGGHSCRVNTDGRLHIIADVDHSIPAGTAISITGVYTIP